MALINAKNGMAAVGLAIPGAGAATNMLNAYLAERQGKAVANGLKPGMDAHQEQLLGLKSHLETTQEELAKAHQELVGHQNRIEAQQRQIDKRSTWLGVFWYILGAATPIALKYGFGIG